ncbi:MAG: hypothetical protein ACR2QO_00700 [Acidimicrobiales bacterium]
MTDRADDRARSLFDGSALAEHPASALPVPPDELVAKIEEAGWPDGLFDRVCALRRNWGEIEAWLDAGFPTVEMIEAWVPQEEALLASTVSVRQAGWDDNGLILDLCANSPERAGDWDVIVERGPYAFAQFRLQENAYVVIVEDRRVGLGIVSRSLRNSYIDGERTTVHFISGWRVRDGLRGLGISKLLMEGAGPGHGFFGVSFYWYVRLENQDSAWVEKVTADMADRPEGWEAETDKLTATVTYFVNPAQGAVSPRARLATPEDLADCCALINRTHAGLDLFRPYSTEFLEGRLDDPSWGPTPSFIDSVYGWDHFAVIEQDGAIVSCGGLWDRGKDLRERWVHRDSGDEHIVEPTALMDFGFAAGHEGAMVELVEHFLATTGELDRTSLLVPFEQTPSLAAACAHLDARPETRELQTMPFVSPDLKVEVNVTKPYTDLAYW